jgi:hypothetical protein
VPEESIIELVVSNNHESLLIIDGREQDRLQQWDIVRVERGAESFRLVTLGNTNFYEAFRTKFKFRIRPEAIPSRRGGGSVMTPTLTTTRPTAQVATGVTRPEPPDGDESPEASDGSIGV